MWTSGLFLSYRPAEGLKLWSQASVLPVGRQAGGHSENKEATGKLVREPGERSVGIVQAVIT